MLSGEFIVCIGNNPWRLHWTTAQQTMSRLAKDNLVLYVEPLHSLPSLLRLSRTAASWQLPAWGLRRESQNLYVYAPLPVAPPCRSRSATICRASGKLLARAIRRRMQALSRAAPILWIFHYETAELVEAIPAKLSIYDCVDEYVGLADNAREQAYVEARERQLLEQVDLTFVICEWLWERKRVYNQHTYIVHNAADVSHIGATTNSETPIPADLAGIKPPRIGYVGMIDGKRIDTELLRYLAVRHPEWSLVMVGKVWFGFDARALNDLPNVHFLGPKQIDVLPGYLQALDVCIIPCRINGLTVGNDPLKLYEYLAAGKPVVSTPIPACKRFMPLIQVADTQEGFEAALNVCLQERDDRLVQARLNSALLNTWEARIKEKSCLIERCLELKRGRP